MDFAPYTHNCHYAPLCSSHAKVNFVKISHLAKKNLTVAYATNATEFWKVRPAETVGLPAETVGLPAETVGLPAESARGMLRVLTGMLGLPTVC